jgi:hypothetical protein
MEYSNFSDKVLIILGGSSFMGLTLLERCSANIHTFSKIYVLNRGKKYWDGASTDIMNKHPDVFHHILQDRDERSAFTN